MRIVHSSDWYSDQLGGFSVIGARHRGGSKGGVGFHVQQFISTYFLYLNKTDGFTQSYSILFYFASSLSRDLVVLEVRNKIQSKRSTNRNISASRYRHISMY